jgi:hypothetical protein
MRSKPATALIATLGLTLSAAFLAPSVLAQRIARSGQAACFRDSYYGPWDSMGAASYTYKIVYTIDCAQTPATVPCKACLRVNLWQWSDLEDTYVLRAWNYQSLDVACGAIVSGFSPACTVNFLHEGDRLLVTADATDGEYCPPSGNYKWTDGETVTFHAP